MSIRAKSLLPVVVLAAVAFVSCGKKDTEGTPTGGSAPAATPLSPGISATLTRNSAPPLYVFDSLGPVNYPAVQKSIQIAADNDIGITGWALDVAKTNTAGAVDVVLDNVPYSARYGLERPDVGSHFNRPDFNNSGFQLVLSRGRLSKGPHAISIRVIASDKKSYNEGPVVHFTVN